MAVAGVTEFRLWSKGSWPRVDVRGEFYHQEAIRELLPRNLPDSGTELEKVAHLIPEPKNRHDRNAVRVEVDGRLIGYLPKEVAGDYVPVLGGLIAKGLRPTTECHIWAYQRDEWKGSDRRGRDIFETVLNAQATLVLSEPHLVVPLNAEPTTPHRVLPHGSALQVRGEEKHLDALTPWIAEHGEGWVHGELRPVTVQQTRSSKEIVEIFIDGALIGELTPAMSAHFLPAIRHVSERGETLIAKVFLKGNPLKVEAVVHGAKAHELPPDWMADRVSRVEGDGQNVASAGAVPVQPAGQDFAIPEKPRVVFRPAPGWPPAPAGWEPPVGWTPLPEWPPAPAGWEFWGLEAVERA